MDVQDDGSQRAVRFIKETFENVKEQLEKLPPGEPSVTFHRITGWKPSHDPDNQEIQWVAKKHEVTYSWPGRTKEEAWRFACVLRILSEIYSAITSNIVVTKRDIFYRDPTLFQKQNVVDTYIDDIAYTCGVRRTELHVAASPKGLVIGLQASAEFLDAELIPVSGIRVDISHVNWVLVVEKEASFKTLVEQRFHLNEGLGRGLVVTAKGYPDLATRSFLRNIVDAGFEGPLFGLFDFDAYGVDILKSYMVGSKLSATERDIALPELKWIGVNSKHIIDLECGTIPLGINDRTKARNMVDSMRLDNRTVPALTDCAEELQRMVMLNRKAEIQAVDTQPGFLSRWVEDQMLGVE